MDLKQLLLTEPVAGRLRCQGRVKQGRDKVRPQGHPAAKHSSLHPGYALKRQVLLVGQCELGPHDDSVGLAVEQGDQGFAEE